MLEFSGPDARAFAHAQFTSDVEALLNGQWQWSAWLDPSGRVRNFFALLRSDADRLLAWLPRGDADAMARRLSMFVMRSKVRIQSLPDYWLLDMPADDASAPAAMEDLWMLNLPGSPPRRAALVNNCAETTVDPDRLEAWIRADIAAGLPWISDETAEEFTPQALGLERLDAISFDKGCYPGQEIVARLHYRGGNKRQCMRVTIESSTPPSAGERIRVDGTPSSGGSILYAAAARNDVCDALAVMPANLPENTRMTLESGPVARPEHLNVEVL
ncbi:MAG: folate-binding protein [Dokdonella sp.]